MESAAQIAPTEITSREWGLLFILSGNMLLDALEVSTAVVALPTIGHGLGLSPLDAQWIITGFALGFGGALLIGRPVVAALGKRRPYLVAVLLFAVASVVGGLAPGGGVLIATRLIKGACAAFTAPTGLAIIATAFREGKDRGRAMSVYTLFGASGFSAGLIISGLLTTALGWRWTFVAPAPVALVLFASGLWLIPRDEYGSDRREATGPWSAVLGNPSLIRSCLGAVTLNGAFWGFLFLATSHLQDTAGWTPFRTALAFLPATLLLLVSVPFGSRLVSRFGTARLIAFGAAAPPIGYALLLPLRDFPAYVPDVLPTVLLVGAGYVLCFSALQVQATSGVPASDRALAGGIYQSSVQIGGALTVILSAAVFTSVGLRASIALITAVGALGLAVALRGAYDHGTRG